MKILITGGGGQVAYEIKRLATQKNISYYAPFRDEMNIAEIQSLTTQFKNFQPDVVINTAAYTQVDRAEIERELVYTANVQGVINLTLLCNQWNCPLIHLSTDYVFDGKNSKAYSEEDAEFPINYYGQSKWKGEEFIRNHAKKYLILRVSSVFGMHGNNFVKTILRLAKEKEEFTIVSDQVSCPTPAAAIADTILKIGAAPHSGIFHYCGLPSVSWYDFAKIIIEEASKLTLLKVKNVKPISVKEYATLAKRPLYSELNCEKIRNIYGIDQPDWKAGLTHVIQQLYSS